MDDYHFIVSAPRSGSTWLTRALNHHPDILATESRLFGMFCELWQNANGKTAPRITADRYLRSFANHSFFGELNFDSPAAMQQDLLPKYLAFIADYLRSRSGKPLIVDKVTPYLGTSGRVFSEIKNHFPRAKIVHLIRDGRDVATSGVFDWIARQNHESDRYRLFVERDSNVTLTRFFDDALLEEWARYWSEPIEAAKKNSAASIEVRYESMLQDQASVLGSIFGALGLAEAPEIAANAVERVAFAETTGRDAGQEEPLAKTRKGIAGDWRNYFTREDAKRFVEFTGDLIQELGYEESNDWIESCPETLKLTV